MLQQSIRLSKVAVTIDSADSAGCPVEGTLTLKSLNGSTWSAKKLGIVVILLFAVTVYAARITGHWQGQVSLGEFRRLIVTIDAPSMRHP